MTMAQEMLQVLAVQHKQGNTRLKFVTIENTLETFQKFVSEGSEERGEIEIVPVSGSIVCVLHKEGKVIGLPPTLAWINGEEVIDVLAGNAFFCREGVDGEFANIEEEDMDFIRNHFRLIKTGGARMDRYSETLQLILYEGFGIPFDTPKGEVEKQLEKETIISAVLGYYDITQHAEEVYSLMEEIFGVAFDSFDIHILCNVFYNKGKYDVFSVDNTACKEERV